jgi:hypothetical protein
MSVRSFRSLSSCSGPVIPTVVQLKRLLVEFHHGSLVARPIVVVLEDVPSLDDAGDQIEVAGGVDSDQEPGVGEGRTENVLVGSGVQVGVRSGIDLPSHERVELPDSEVDATAGQEAWTSEVHVELRQVDPDAVHVAVARGSLQAETGRRVESREVIEKAIGGEERRVVADEEVHSVADVELYVFERILENEVQLVQTEIIGSPIEVDPEVDPILRTVEVRGESGLEPAGELVGLLRSGRRLLGASPGRQQQAGEQDRRSPERVAKLKHGWLSFVRIEHGPEPAEESRKGV